MRKRLEVEIEDDVKKRIDEYARKKGMRLPFAYGDLLSCGLKQKLKEDGVEEP